MFMTGLSALLAYAAPVPAAEAPVIDALHSNNNHAASNLVVRITGLDGSTNHQKLKRDSDIMDIFITCFRAADKTANEAETDRQNDSDDSSLKNRQYGPEFTGISERDSDIINFDCGSLFYFKLEEARKLARRNHRNVFDVLNQRSAGAEQVEGSKREIISPYSDDINAADVHAVLGE